MLRVPLRPVLTTAVATCVLGACSSEIAAPAGPVGHAERLILLNSLAIMLVVVIPTIVATFVIAWWFRASNTRARYRPHWDYSGRLELITWSIPTLIILFLSGVIWTGSHQLDPARTLGDKPLEIQVVSLDWKWLFIYPEQRIATVNQLVVPIGVPIRFSLTSASVMNQFFVPQLGGMIATMNRMVTHLNVQADRPGTFYGQSAQFSGDGFSDMHFMVRAVPNENFTQWVAATVSAGPELDRASYAELVKQSRNVAPLTFRRADTELFAAIVSHSIPPGPGPRPEPMEKAQDTR